MFSLKRQTSRGAPDPCSLSLSLSFPIKHFFTFPHQFPSFSLHLKHFTHNPPTGRISPPLFPSALYSSPSVRVELSLDLFLYSSGRKDREEMTRPPVWRQFGHWSDHSGAKCEPLSGTAPLQTALLFFFLLWFLNEVVRADAQRRSKSTSRYLAFPSLCFVSLSPSLSLHKWFSKVPQMAWRCFSGWRKNVVEEK